MIPTEELATAAYEALRKTSPQSRERLFEVLCAKYPSRISKADVKAALQLLEKRATVNQVRNDIWAATYPQFPPAVSKLPAVADHQPSLRISAGEAFAVALRALPTVTDSSTAVVWSEEQRAVIEAERSDRLLVEAGPGTGKTAVACARVAHLLNQGVAGHGIIMISFTRTAVTELRQRIRLLAREAAGASSVRITTLDSEAWHLGVAVGQATKEERFNAGYSANIRDAAKQLKNRDPVLLEWLEGTQHVIIDEGQDLVGDRAELVFCFLDCLLDETGVTIFVDPAQAIYGFSSDVDDEDEAPGANAFHEELLQQFDFRRLALTKLFRTSSPALQRVFETGRTIAMGALHPEKRMKRLRELVQANCAHREQIDKHRPEDCELVLFRRRSEVLLASSFLSRDGVPHRLRLSQTELGIQPWVGAVLHLTSSTRLSEGEFLRAWAQVEHLPIMAGASRVDAWASLLRIARAPQSAQVDVRALRRVLSHDRPPPEFSLTEAGLTGPILGTIHASKGRESPLVRLMLPDRKGKGESLEDEIRVEYVGATRARDLMTFGKGYVARGLSGLGAPGGRLQRVSVQKNSAMFEVGRPGDFDSLSVVSRACQSSSRVAQALQEKLRRYDGMPAPVRALQLQAEPWSYLVSDAGGSTMWGAFSQRINKDLRALRMKCKNPKALLLPFEIKHMYQVGVRTVVLAEDSPGLASLHEPWATSGVFLAPVIKGLTTVYFQFKKGSSWESK